MLPLGRKNARRCTECDITCHANCAHLVPDFCGMSMETANILLRDWKDINRARGDRRQQQQKPAYAPPSQWSGAPPQIESPMEQISSDMDRMQLGGNEPPPPPKPADYPYARQSPQLPAKDLRQDSRMAPPMQQAPSPYPPSTPSSAARPLPTGPSGRPAFPTEPTQPSMQQGRPAPPYDQDPSAYQVCSTSAIVSMP